MWRNRSRLRRWLVSLGIVLTLTTILVCGALYCFLRIPNLPLPSGVSRYTQELTLAGKPVKVDLYVRLNSASAPVAVVAHGFSRNRKTMAGWGGLLAQAGFLAVVPDLPSWTDHARNGRALAELLAKVRSGELLPRPQPSGGAALVGFSAGGLSTLLAAAGNTNVSCWVGLDPVGMGSMAIRSAKTLAIPTFVLRAEPAPWNANGNAREIFAALPGPAFSLVVNSATHVDAEYPTSRAADWVCGKSDPVRRELFGRYLLASLRVGLLHEEASLRQLRAATNDAAVREVLFKRLEAFHSAG